jgi:hypothetical protein
LRTQQDFLKLWGAEPVKNLGNRYGCVNGHSAPSVLDIYFPRVQITIQDFTNTSKDSANIESVSMFHDSNVPQQGSASAQVLAYYNWLEPVTPAQEKCCKKHSGFMGISQDLSVVNLVSICSI